MNAERSREGHLGFEDEGENEDEKAQPNTGDADGARVPDSAGVPPSWGMARSVIVKESPDHLLVWNTTLVGLTLEEVHARAAERNGHLHCFFPERQFVGGRKKVSHNSDFAHRFVSVFHFVLHKVACLSANTQHR